ncbi:MAG: PQQ-binding-like beta-propeller repeat protein [Chloracidobacterium sp.]|nr:PQQ-binding-like beta-propeller repeat protein [Chloracidobacterium sp.]
MYCASSGERSDLRRLLGQKTIMAIDAESGQEKWKYKTPHRPISYPIVGNGVIYYIDEEGIMYALGSS